MLDHVVQRHHEVAVFVAAGTDVDQAGAGGDAVERLPGGGGTGAAVASPEVGMAPRSTSPSLVAAATSGATAAGTDSALLGARSSCSPTRYMPSRVPNARSTCSAVPCAWMRRRFSDTAVASSPAPVSQRCTAATSSGAGA